MNNYYYYFVVFFFHHLIVQLCNCSECRGPSLDLDNLADNQSIIDRYRRGSLTYREVVALISKNLNPILEKENINCKYNHRERRDINAGNMDVKALQTTINDNRVMIEYLFNNSINPGFLKNALYNHDRKAPSLSSWRDLVDILGIALISIILLYLLLCRTGCSKCDKMLFILFKPVLNRTEQNQQQYQQQPLQFQHPTQLLQPKQLHQPIQIQQPIQQEQQKQHRQQIKTQPQTHQQTQQQSYPRPTTMFKTGVLDASPEQLKTLETIASNFHYNNSYTEQ